MCLDWKKYTLGDLYTVHNGLSKNGKFFGRGYPFLSFSTVFNNYFIPQEIPDLVESTEKEQENYSIKRGDVFVTRTSETKDELGMSCVSLQDYPQATYNGFTKRLRPKNSAVVLPEFIGYYLRNPSFRQKFKAFSQMTTRASLKNENLLGLVINVPNCFIQKKIASILSAYDTLIENNRKQIKLLEEAAQRLYKEWFVDFHFPGHENVMIIDGVPEGWSKVSINDLGEYLNGYAFKPIDWGESGYPIIKIKEMNEGISNSTPRNTGVGIPTKYVINAGDILFSWSATLSVLIWGKERGLLNQHIFKVTPRTGISREFVYQSISIALEKFRNITTGATMKHIQRGKLKEVYVLLPCSKIMDNWELLTAPIREKILLLNQETEILVESRNRLLPKLMSGEIEVTL